jgi:hypothetical protein
MTTCQTIQAQLSAFVDGTTDAETASAIDSHIAGCEACRGLAEDLVRLRDAARGLGPIAPPASAWTGIAAGLDDAAPAAALLLITLGLYAVERFSLTGDDSTGNAPARASVEGVNGELRLALDHYENAISQLKVLAATNDDVIDPEIAATFDRNMAIVDAVIAESHEALDADPGNQPARASLLEALSQKVNVLQSAVLLMNEMREGDPAGAVGAAGGTTGHP